MPDIHRRKLLVLFCLGVGPVAAASDFSAELARGDGLLARMEKMPLKAQKNHFEARIGDEVVGYALVSIDPVGRDRFKCLYEMVAAMPAVRISGVVSAVVDARLRPARIDMTRTVRRADGQSMTRHETCAVGVDKIVLTGQGRPGKPTETKALPREPFFFSADLLLARTDMSQVKEPFALRELNPQKGELRLLVFRPSATKDGASELRSFVDDKDAEGTYRFDKAGRLLSWSEAGAPLVMIRVDEKQGQALRKRFGPPTTRPASRGE